MSVLDNIYFSRFIRPMNLSRKAHDSESLLYSGCVSDWDRATRMIRFPPLIFPVTLHPPARPATRPAQRTVLMIFLILFLISSFLHSSLNLPPNELSLFTCRIYTVPCVSSYIYKLSITCIVLDCKQFLVYFFTIFILCFCVFFTKSVVFPFLYWPFSIFGLPFM